MPHVDVRLIMGKRGSGSWLAISICIAALCFFFSAAPAYAEEHPDPTTVERLGGANRFETMANIVDIAYPSDETTDIAVVAVGDDFPDALAGSGIAGLHNAPILITGGNNLNADTAEQLQRRHVKDVYVLGSSASISNRVVEQIQQLIPGEVKRLGGANRFETAHEIYREGVGTWGNTAIIATGTTPADAISIASYSYAEAAPIFLAAYGLDKGTEEALLEGGFSRVLICGDTNSIDASVDAWCSDHAIDVVRFAGINRYDTNTKIINWLTDNELFQWDKAVVAAGQDGKWADALCAGPLVAKRGTVLLLADDYNRTTITGALHDHALPVLSTTVLGDENSVSQETFKTLKDSIAKTWIEERQWVRKVETIWAEETRSVPEIYTVKGQDHSMPTVEDPQSIVDKGYCCSGCGLEAAYSDINSNSEAIKDARTSSIIESHVATACPLSSGWTSYCKVATGGTVEENYGGHYEKTDRGGWENTAAYWSLYPDCDTTKQWVEDSTWTTDLEKVWVPNPESERSWLCKCDVCGFSSPCENLNLYTEHLLPGCMQTPRFLLVEQTVHNGYWKQIDTSYAQVTGGHWE